MNEPFSFEEYLEQNGTLTYSNKGTSMEPLLRQGRDLFTVARKGPERCRAGDVVLFRRGGNYVLHRVIRVRETDYICLGDNAVRKEYGVRDEDILGVLTGIVRNGKEYRTEDPRLRAYTAWILATAGARVLRIRIVEKIRRTIKAFLK